MRVWIVNPFSEPYDRSGVPGRFTSLARVFAGRGHEVTWWSSTWSHRDKCPREVLEDVAPCEVVLLGTPPYERNVGLARLRNHRCYALAFAQQAQERVAADPSQCPDLIHLSMPPLGPAQKALELKARWGCRVTVDIMDLWPQTFTRLIPGPAFFKELAGRLLFAPGFADAKRAYCGADAVTAVSREYIDKVLQLNPRQHTRTVYVGGHVDEGVMLHERPKSPVVFIYVGTLSDTYDLTTVLEAAAALKADGVAWRFEVHFAGSGAGEADLRAKVDSLGLGDTVRFLGFLNQQQLSEALASAHVGLNAICAGTYITMPHKLGDYLCAGLPVINSTSGEPQRLLADHDAGLTYQVGSADSLAGVMKKYFMSGAFLEVQRANARQLGQEQFDRALTYPQMAEFLESGAAVSASN